MRPAAQAELSPPAEPESLSTFWFSSAIWRFSSSTSLGGVGEAGSSLSWRSATPPSIATPKGLRMLSAWRNTAMFFFACSSIAWKAWRVGSPNGPEPRAASICSRNFCWSRVNLSIENSR